MFRKLVILSGLTFQVCAFAQTFSPNKLPIHVSYYGDNLIHPGFKLGTSYSFLEWEKSKIRKFKKRAAKYGGKYKYKTLNAVTNLGLYSHPNNDFGLFYNIGLGYERTKARKGNMFGLTLELGYLRNINQFKTEQLNENGEIETVPFAGQNGYMVSFSPVFGRDLIVKRALPVKWFIKPSLQLVKYNHGLFPNATFELGLIMNLKREKNEK